MTDDAVADAAAKSLVRKAALKTTAERIRRRLDPRLLAADVAKVALAQAITQLGAIQTTPRQRKRALIGAALAGVAAVGLRVVYRNSVDTPSPALQDDVTQPE